MMSSFAAAVFSRPSKAPDASWTGRACQMLVPLVLIGSATTSGHAATITVYDVRNAWGQAVGSSLIGHEFASDTMTGGIDDPVDHDRIVLPTGIASITATGGEADSVDDMTFQHLNSNLRDSDDGASEFLETGQQVLRLRFSTYTSQNLGGGSGFLVGPNRYLIEFNRPVVAFSFDYSRTGNAFMEISRGVYADVAGTPVNLSFLTRRGNAGFFGILSSAPIQSFSLYYTFISGMYTYANFDNFAVVYALASNPPQDPVTPSPIPIPASLLLLLAPLSILAGLSLRRRSRRAA